MNSHQNPSGKPQQDKHLNTRDVLSAVNDCARIVMTATEHQAVSIRKGLHFINWAHDYFYTAGDTDSQKEMYRCQMILSARKAFMENETGRLVRLCREIQHFEDRARQKRSYKPNYSESVARVLELTGKAFINREDYTSAIKYLSQALAKLNDIVLENPTYQIDGALRESISKALHYARHHHNG